jgi:hypothetical protein
MSMERVCDVFQNALLFPIYGQYFCVAVGITRVVDAMSLIVFLHAKQSTAITQKRAPMHSSTESTFVASTIQKSSTLKK